jgi:nucleotide-binding universal stress UspA family protein
MPRLTAVRTKNETGKDVVALVLSQDAVALDLDGNPWCGVALDAEQSRTLARRLEGFACEIESSEGRTQPPAREIRSVAVLHDGSQQSHRAVQTALKLAALKVDLIGIVGINPEIPETQSLLEDYERHRDWFNRLIPAYAEQAAEQGVRFESTVVESNTCDLRRALQALDFDLIVVPGRLTQLACRDGEPLIDSLARGAARILVSP